MLVSCHQPNYLPWSGFFYKMMNSDTFVVMDSCQYPRGSSFVNRNRIKTPPSNSLWITVPIIKKGKGFQNINEVRIDNTIKWQRKHIASLFHFYKRAPFFMDYLDFLRNIYSVKWEKLVTLNIEIIRFFVRYLNVETKIYFLSELNLRGKGTALLVRILKTIGGDSYLSSLGGKKYINENFLKQKGIEVRYYKFNPPVYPQLWGDFLYNLSIIDLVLNCGNKARDVIMSQNKRLL